VSARTRGLAALWLVLAAACQVPEASFTACDVRASTCHEQLARTVDAIRGRTWDPWWPGPDVAVITPEDHRRIAERVARDLRRAAASGLWTGALQQVGLLGLSVDVTSADQAWFETAGANYWAQAKLVTLVDRGQTLSGPAASALLAHELVHAAQDRELNFVGFSPLTTDQEMVRMALTEGEAVLYGKLAELQMRGDDVAAFDWTAYFGEWIESLRQDTEDSISAHAHIRLSFPYPVGGAAMSRAWLALGATGVNRYFQRPPRSFLHLMLAAEGAPAPEEGVPGDCSRPYAVRAGGAAGVDTLGAALFYGHLANTFRGNEPGAWAAARTWRGDRLWLFLDSNNRSVPFWRIHAPGIRDTPLGAMLAAQTHPPLLEGDDVLFWTNVPDELVAELRGQLTCRWPISQ
jgi:hypothetical protein